MVQCRGAHDDAGQWREDGFYPGAHRQRQIHGPIQPSEALKQCHDGRVAPGPSLAVSRQLIYWSIKRLMRGDQPDQTPRLAGLEQVTAVV